MEASNISSLLFLFFFSLLQTSTIAIKKSYIVNLDLPSSFALDPSSLSTHFQQVTAFHYDLLGSLLGSKKMAKEAIFYSYTRSFNGFAAKLDEKEAADLARNPNVISVLENKARKLQTTRSWNFLGLENDDEEIPSNSLWELAKFGEDVIVGNIDTGVWPESKSFSDEGYGPVPSKWRGICQTDSNFHCNKKLIGGRYFYKGFEAAGGTLNASVLTVRDYDGHGTHTLSTAAGNFVAGANVFGHGNGTAKGGAPKARVAAYKVCWPPYGDGVCYDADIVAAFEAAIADGVDVISGSIGSAAVEFHNDPLAMISFQAVQQGIVVVVAAGNSGPLPNTVTNVAPWVTTVAASTMDRDFASYVALGNKKQLKGVSLSSVAPLPEKFYPLISSVDAKLSNIADSSAQFCDAGTLDPIKVKGKILICLSGGEVGPVDKGYYAAQEGAVGMILTNNIEQGDEIVPQWHFLPASDITGEDAKLLQQYLTSTKTPVAQLAKVKTELGIKPAPVMASFSSRGPNPVVSTILKPDITAPGVNILASYPTVIAPSPSALDKRRIPFNVFSGTSMSCPHISGIAALLKSVHPEWSPSAIKSAIMTTAKMLDNNGQTILDWNKVEATPFAYGAGHVDPNAAMDPGLVYDATLEDYLNFLCARGYNAMEIKKFYDKPFTCDKSFQVLDLNYPSFTIGEALKIGAPVTVNRRIKNVGSPGTYVVEVKVSPEVEVSVEPSTLQFSGEGEEKAFKVVLQNTGKVKHEGYVFGTLIWSDGKHFVSSPIAINLG